MEFILKIILCLFFFLNRDVMFFRETNKDLGAGAGMGALNSEHCYAFHAVGVEQYVHQHVSSLTPDFKLTGASATFTTFAAFTLLPDLHKQEECKECRVIRNCSPKSLFLLCCRNIYTFCTGPTLQKSRQYCPSPRLGLPK